MQYSSLLRVVFELFELSSFKIDKYTDYDCKYFNHDFKDFCLLLIAIQNLPYPQALLRSLEPLQFTHVKHQLAQFQMIFIVKNILPLLDKNPSFLKDQDIIIKFMNNIIANKRDGEKLRQSFENFTQMQLTRDQKSLN